MDGACSVPSNTQKTEAQQQRQSPKLSIEMGCGSSRESMNDRACSSSSSSSSCPIGTAAAAAANSSGKKRFIDACREQLHLAMADATCKSIANSAVSPHDASCYIHLNDQEEEEAEEASRRQEARNHVVDISSYPNDSEEYLENKPPLDQQVTVRSHHHSSHSPRRTSPLQEISITSHGKLIGLAKEYNKYDISPTHVNCPTNVLPGPGFPPPRPPSNLKPTVPKVTNDDSSCCTLVRDSLIPPPPIQAWLNSDHAHFPSKDVAQDVASDADSVEPSTYNSSALGPDAYVHIDDDLYESAKSSTTILDIDELIEKLAVDCQSQDIETKIDTASIDVDELANHFKMIRPPNTYMRDLSEHFDKSNEPLHMPATPRMGSWQSKLLETIDRDIANILLDDQDDVALVDRKDEIDELIGSSLLQVDQNQYERIEL